MQDDLARGTMISYDMAWSESFPVPSALSAAASGPIRDYLEVGKKSDLSLTEENLHSVSTSISNGLAVLLTYLFVADGLVSSSLVQVQVAKRPRSWDVVPSRNDILDASDDDHGACKLVQARPSP